MTTLYCYRGLPGSGKSTAARIFQATGPDHTVIVNRDSIRKRLFGDDGQDYYACAKETLHRKETLVTEAQHAEITAALKAGFDVVCDDTNLPVRRCRELRALATRCGAEFVLDGTFAEVPLETCLARNAARTDKEPVPVEVIESMWKRYLRGGLAPVPDEEPTERDLVFKPYVRPEGKPLAIIVDTDGTVANHEPHRSPYDTSKYDQDTPIQDVVELVQNVYWRNVVKVIGLSGRSDEFREVTLDWWFENVDLDPDEFYMRAEGDSRKDYIIKSELFDTHIADRFNVIGVIDDRPSVCRMWRAKGLTTFQVGDPEKEF